MFRYQTDHKVHLNFFQEKAVVCTSFLFDVYIITTTHTNNINAKLVFQNNYEQTKRRLLI